jgi:hypothetical protein
VSTELSQAAQAILNSKALAHVASLGPEGEPHVTPVSVDLDGNDLIINTALGRAKARNLANDPAWRSRSRIRPTPTP